jgi:hypothetical protein
LRVVDLPLRWRALLRRPARRLVSRLAPGEEVRAVAVVRHRRRSGGLAAVEAFQRGSGAGLLVLTDRRLVLAGRRGWLEVPCAAVFGTGSREGRRGSRQLVVHTTAGELMVDGMARRTVHAWRRALAVPVAEPTRATRPARLRLVGAPAAAS